MDYDQLLIDLTLSRRPALILGKAGTGKTNLMSRYYSHISARRQVAIITPTGLSSLQYDEARTAHSRLRLPIGIITLEDLEEREIHDPVLEQVTDLIIDEVSMVRADTLDGIDLRLRQLHKRSEPFGGVRVILVGDPYQIPPVTPPATEGHLKAYMGLEKDKRTDFFFFMSRVFQDPAFQNNLKVYSLEKNYRQIDDPEYATILDAVRLGKISEKQLEVLNSRVGAWPSGTSYTTLCTEREIAEGVNHLARASLAGEEYHFEPVVSPPEKAHHPLVRNHVASSRRSFKIGERVMVLRNGTGDRPSFVNGSQGELVGVELDQDGTPVAARVDLRQLVPESLDLHYFTVTTPQYSEEKGRIVNQEIATIKNIPLLSATALTIHRGQGLTMDRVNVNLGRGAFADGQLYVALSRVRKLEDLGLVVPISRADVKVSTEVAEFMQAISARVVEVR